MGAMLDNNILNTFTDVMGNTAQLWFRVLHAISTLLSIFEVVKVFFTLPFYHVVIYDLTACRSIGHPSVLVPSGSLKSLLTFYSSRWQKE